MNNNASINSLLINDSEYNINSINQINLNNNIYSIGNGNRVAEIIRASYSATWLYSRRSGDSVGMYGRSYTKSSNDPCIILLFSEGSWNGFLLIGRTINSVDYGKSITYQNYKSISYSGKTFYYRYLESKFSIGQMNCDCTINGRFLSMKDYWTNVNSTNLLSTDSGKAILDLADIIIP